VLDISLKIVWYGQEKQNAGLKQMTRRADIWKMEKVN